MEMIELGKKYRTASPIWEDPVIHEIECGYAFGRVGLYPVAWLVCSGKVSELPTNTAEHAADWALVEVLPEVTVRAHLHRSRNPDHPEAVVSTSDHIVGMVTFGALDITHNGKEITDVKVVK